TCVSARIKRQIIEHTILKKKIERFREYIRTKGVTSYAIRRFRDLVRTNYRERGRDLPWRKTRDPYRILVSEIMLQQTQVPRVLEKYPEFLKAFPDFTSLARAPKIKLLKVWQGMGYNRRALNLQKAAGKVVEQFGGKLPQTYERLIELPGIGPATASDILAFAYNKPAVVIETNIRAVFIHMFFPDSEDIHDEDILPLIEKTMDRKNPCDWYNGLMDFGTELKGLFANPARKSRHYTRQSKFEGSNRQVRSRILKYILEHGRTGFSDLARAIPGSEQRLENNLIAMKDEGFIMERSGIYTIKDSD
ncbi:MAG: A/G-specific adenine glycosylase, partial [Chitinivibrionales bacterium]|nr:A/G-specific adenine glycosylase [Chitinivibrionales bacterium]